MWKKVQAELWSKWKNESPELSTEDLWVKNKHEWIEAYRPFVKDRTPLFWLRKV